MSPIYKEVYVPNNDLKLISQLEQRGWSFSRGEKLTNDPTAIWLAQVNEVRPVLQMFVKQDEPAKQAKKDRNLQIFLEKLQKHILKTSKESINLDEARHAMAQIFSHTLTDSIPNGILTRSVGDNTVFWRKAKHPETLLIPKTVQYMLLGHDLIADDHFEQHKSKYKSKPSYSSYTSLAKDPVLHSILFD